MTNDEKKAWLNRYGELKDRKEYLEDKIAELEARKYNITSKLSDMPKGCDHPHSDDIIVAQNEKIRECECQILNIKCMMDEIDCSISTIDNWKVEKVMRLRYIDCLEWFDIYVEMKYEHAQTHRYHAEGLKHIEIPT